MTSLTSLGLQDPNLLKVLTLSIVLFLDGSSARGSASGEEEWSEDMEEPEMEFDEMGLELAAQDGKFVLSSPKYSACETIWMSATALLSLPATFSIYTK